MVYKIVSAQDIPKQAMTTPENLINLYEVCQQMSDICEAEGGIGLSAFQIGLPWKVFVVKQASGYEYYVDCDYEPIVDTDVQISIEGCLSLRNSSGKLRRFKIKRYKSVRVWGKRLVVNDGRLELVDINFVSAGDIFTVIFQHEIDHQKQILIESIGQEIDITK
jgi:peptide deformylase